MPNILCYKWNLVAIYSLDDFFIRLFLIWLSAATVLQAFGNNPNLNCQDMYLFCGLGGDRYQQFLYKTWRMFQKIKQQKGCLPYHQVFVSVPLGLSAVVYASTLDASTFFSHTHCAAL